MSCESQHGDGPVLQAVSILTILPGDYVWCFESWNIISEPKIKSERYKASLLHEPFNLLFRVESLFFIKELKSSAGWLCFPWFSHNSSFSETKKWQYLQAQQVPILNFPMILGTRKWKNLKMTLTVGPKQAWMLLLSLLAENSVLGWLEAPCGRQTHLTLVHHHRLMQC